MSTNDSFPVHDGHDTEFPHDQFAELVGQLELLEAETEQLRQEVARAKQARYHRTALGLTVLAVIAGLGALAFPDIRPTLVTLSGIGFFGALLVYYLTPEAFIAADVGERVYDTFAANITAIADDLGLDDEWRYLPHDDGISVYVPQTEASVDPSPDDGPFIIDAGSRGLVFESTGSRLLDVVALTFGQDVGSTPGDLAIQLADAAVEQFELARQVETDVEPGRATFAITESTFDDVDRFDHPLASLLAAGMARGLDTPVTLVVDPGDEYQDWLVTCRWDDNE